MTKQSSQRSRSTMASSDSFSLFLVSCIAGVANGANWKLLAIAGLDLSLSLEAVSGPKHYLDSDLSPLFVAALWIDGEN